MRNLTIYLLILACAAVSVHAMDAIQISATKKTADSRSSAPQDLPRGRSVATEKDVYYVFEIRSLSTDVPNDLRVEWQILVEKVGGSLQPRTQGNQDININFGQTVKLETEEVKLRSRQWTSGRTGSVQESIAGYAVRVLTTAGEVLAEKYRPSTIADEITWDTPARPRQMRTPRQRPSRSPGGWRNARPL